MNRDFVCAQTAKKAINAGIELPKTTTEDMTSSR